MDPIVIRVKGQRVVSVIVYSSGLVAKGLVYVREEQCV